MNKIAIPAILVATVMVAGMFAFMPVEQASTVHTSGITSQVSDIDVLDEVVGDESGTGTFLFLVDVANIAAGENFEARFNLQLTDSGAGDGVNAAATVLVEVWDGDEWIDAQVNEPTPANEATAHTANIVVTGISTAVGEIRFTVDEGGEVTEATLDISGIIIE